MSQSLTSSPSRSRPRGWWIPYTFVAAFAVIIAVNGAMLYFATSTFSGLSTQHAYVEGLAYNDRVAEEQAQARLGWRIEADLAGAVAHVADAPTRQATLRLTATDAQGRPLEGLSIEALVRRPTEQGMDQTVTLAPMGAGLYQTVVTLPKPGQWDLLFTAYRGDDTFKLRRRLRAD